LLSLTVTPVIVDCVPPASSVRYPHWPGAKVAILSHKDNDIFIDLGKN